MMDSAQLQRIAAAARLDDATEVIARAKDAYDPDEARGLYEYAIEQLIDAIEILGVK